MPTAAAAHADRELPPPAFHSSPAASEPLDLPLPRVDGALFETLRGRRTTRGFDPDAAIGQDELGLVLYYTFGCHGRVDLGGGLEILKKTSPSGGGLHPIEAYPLVVDVDGVAPGLHHYRADRHALELLLPLEPSAAADLLVDLCAGQRYLATARALVVMTARFGRSFWKYRSTRAYAVVLMDAAHLSQTLYLVAGQLGLGAFVSAAVNGANIEELLGIDGVEEGAIAVCGLGRPSAQRSPYDLVFEPYVPRAR